MQTVAAFVKYACGSQTDRKIAIHMKIRLGRRVFLKCLHWIICGACSLHSNDLDGFIWFHYASSVTNKLGLLNMEMKLLDV